MKTISVVYLLRSFQIALLFALLPVASCRAASSDPSDPIIVASFRIPVTALPLIVAASDGHVWMALNEDQRFIRVDALNGESTSYGFANGGASVLSAAAGPYGSLWYIDGLNNTTVWRIDSDGSYRSFAIAGLPLAPLGDLARDDEGGVWVVRGGAQTIIDLDSSGALSKTVSLPPEYSVPARLTRASDGSLWFVHSDGIAWFDAQQHVGSFKMSVPRYIVSCSDRGVAYLRLATEPYAHADDYIVGWADTTGLHPEVRRWPVPPSPPTPSPRPLFYLRTVGCGICGGTSKIVPPRITLLACTTSSAWVRVVDVIERVPRNGPVTSKRLDALATTAENMGVVGPHAWIYDVKPHRLLELGFRDDYR